MGNNQDNFQLHRFTRRDNTAKSFRGLLFLTHTVRYNNVWSELCQCMRRAGKFQSNFDTIGDIPANYFYTASEFLTTLSLTVFTHSNLVADFFQLKCTFASKMAILRFEPPLGGGGLGVT